MHLVRLYNDGRPPLSFVIPEYSTYAEAARVAAIKNDALASLGVTAFRWVAPFNPGIHAALVDLGYMFSHYDSTFEDIGDAENGPQLIGDPAYEVYTSDDEEIVVDEGGHVIHRANELYGDGDNQ